MTPAHSLVASLADKISLPVVYHRIQHLIVTPEAKIDDYVEVIEMDPALAARMIRIANSTFFGYGRKAQTVKQAITLIGVMQLHDLLLSSLAIRAFSGIPIDVFNQDTFWRSCVFCGITARLLAKQCRMPGSEKLFTSGLLHEIGHIVMYTRIPEQIQEVILEAQQNSISLVSLEQKKLGFNYADVGKEVMRLWNLPENYWRITADHIHPMMAKDYQLETAIISFSHALMEAEEEPGEMDLEACINESPDILSTKLTVEGVEKTMTTARLFVDEVMDCLWPFARAQQQSHVILY
jgi:HD-like signal output (HDOD) protein